MIAGFYFCANRGCAAIEHYVNLAMLRSIANETMGHFKFHSMMTAETTEVFNRLNHGQSVPRGTKGMLALAANQALSCLQEAITSPDPDEARIFAKCALDWANEAEQEATFISNLTLTSMPLSKTDDILLSMSAESLKRLYEMAENAMKHIQPAQRKVSIGAYLGIEAIFTRKIAEYEVQLIKDLLAKERPEDVMDVACEIAKACFPRTTADVSLGDRFLSTERNRRTGMQEWFGVANSGEKPYAAMDNCDYYEEFDCPYDMLCKAAAYNRA